ncbi:MAG: 5-oxoprolinase subunit PxpA [Paracoccus sp. (in: a-proteobacteria)]|uniref:LamB/YcsF family protein n=1 Tax=Paracoccus sp. TaxID=267 RepID=UPI0039E2C121
MPHEFDLNADMGEGYGAWRLGDDHALLAELTSANIACGYHAGDAGIMAATCARAAELGVAIGAHIGLPDLIGFGRRRMQIDGPGFAAHVLYQLGALQCIARAAGTKVTHISFHGALGDMACADEGLAMCLIGAVAGVAPELVVSTSPGTMLMRAAGRHGMRSLGIFSADRGFAEDGKLLPRSHPQALLTDPEALARRIRRFIREGVVETVTGTLLPVDAQTMMIHGDTPDAPRIARAIRHAVAAEGALLVPLHRLAPEAPHV